MNPMVRYNTFAINKGIIKQYAKLILKQKFTKKYTNLE